MLLEVAPFYVPRNMGQIERNHSTSVTTLPIAGIL